MTAPVVEVEALRREFGSFVAVDDVSFHVERGEIFGYLGANGAGKSTTIRMLCGLLTPTSGRAVVAGCRVGEQATELRSRIGYMSQKFSLYLDLMVEENIDFFGGAYGLYGRALRERRDELLERLHLSEVQRTLTVDLPGGTRQRVALATALLHRPEIVFLDEPTAGVDPGARREFWRLIRELAAEGTTVFVTTHYMDEAEYCARIGLMVSGRLVALDTPRELKRAWVPGAVLALRGVEQPRVEQGLEGCPGVLAVAPFGATVRVRFDPDALSEAELRRRLGEIAPDARAETTLVSLEDVFLAVVSSDANPAGTEAAQ